MSDSLIKEVENRIKILEKEAVKINEANRIRAQRFEENINKLEKGSKKAEMQRGQSNEEESFELNEVKKAIIEIKNNIINEKNSRRVAKKENNKFFFHPIKESIEKTEVAVEMVKTNPEFSRECFYRAYELWADNKDYLLNLAKFCYENNELLEAISYLVSFVEKSSENDYYHVLIKDFLNYEVGEFSGENKNIRFKVSSEELTIEEVYSNGDFILPYSYRIPTDLKIQPYDKLSIQGSLDPREYQFLTRIQIENSISNQLEICLPISCLSDFVNNFVGTLKETDSPYEYLINLNQIDILKYVNEQKIIALKKEPNYYDDAFYTVQELQLKMEDIVSFIVLQLESEQEEVFIEGYKRFILRYVLPQKNLNQLLHDKKVELKNEEKNIITKKDTETEMQNYIMDEAVKVVTDSFIEVNVVPYAKLVVRLENVKNGVHPDTTADEKVYRKAFNKYLNIFGETYKEYLIQDEINEISQTKIRNTKLYNKKSEIIDLISNNKLKNDIEKEWDIVLNSYKDKDNVRCMVSMRKTLEVLAYAHSLKVGKASSKNLDLKKQYDQLNLFINNEEILRKIDDIRGYANQKVHYYRLDERKFTDVNTISREQIYQYYYDVLVHYIKEIKI